ncbi:hypothetical protein [Niabella soli]|uniref:Uncharacterized protein n=1 Tax=Niabella soli DSM 19437 TaxID=929713 RepID=W0F2V8_9BACT|nr:hypothetical protein [Niabella soli]AHF17375.1 hypothetical protein NIASO_06400 [Niabella soli DSM 19437]
MNSFRKVSTYARFIFSGLFFLSSVSLHATPDRNDTARKSTAAEALAYLNGIGKLSQSKWWPNVAPGLLLQNLKTFTTQPFAFYEGKATNFCSYSAITYIPLTYDPLGFATFMIELYRNGKAKMGKEQLKPSRPVRTEAGLLRYKGSLDINAAGQMWFLTLADHFKGYINRLNFRFQKGDENTLWSATNYAKFNRMLRRLFPGTVKARGSDLFKPHINNLADFLEEKLQKGIVFLYLNNKKLHRITHARSLVNMATHYVLLTGIRDLPNEQVEFIYWDYGAKIVQQLPARFLDNIIYGITLWSPGKQK